jgi:hypothetical protein
MRAEEVISTLITRYFIEIGKGTAAVRINVTVYRTFS